MSESGNGSGHDSPRYRFDTRIATGGMGEVWKATDVVLGREVAVKLLKPEYTDDPTFRSRFETEARNAAQLHHPNVASVFDFGELSQPDDGGSPRPYLVMELVRGEPLSALLRTGERMPADTAANLLAQAADGLAAAHDLGIVHRDVKPANLLVTPDRTVKITDFGIARAGDAVALTQTGQVVGTPQYLSPEQAEGRSATGASDIYSLGVVLYECLAGTRPFTGDSPIAIALAHLREEPPPLPDDVPAWLRETTAVALAKDPAARFESVRDFASALRGGPIQAGAGAAGSDDADAPTRVAGAAAAGGAAGLAAGAAAGAAADEGPPPQEPVDEFEDDQWGTRSLAPTPPRDDDGPDERRRRFPAWLPWVAAAVAVVAVVLLLNALSDRNSNETPTDTDTGSATPSAEPSATEEEPSPTERETSAEPSPTEPETVDVNPGDYRGRPADEARSELEALGLEVEEQTVDNPEGEEAGTVADVSPSGRVEVGSTVTLSVYDDPLPTDVPTEDPTDDSENGNSGQGGDDSGGGGEGE